MKLNTNDINKKSFLNMYNPIYSYLMQDNGELKNEITSSPFYFTRLTKTNISFTLTTKVAEEEKKKQPTNLKINQNSSQHVL